MVDVNAILDSVHEAVQKNKLFGDLLSAKNREYLMQNGLVRTAEPGIILCRQAQRDNRVFIIITGQVEVTEKVHGQEIPLGFLGPGEIFGEIAALFMTPRIATVTVVKPTVVLEIPGEILEQLISESQEIRDAVYERYLNRTLETTLRAVPIFSGLSDSDIQALGKGSSLMTARKGELIIKEGEQGDGMYIIKHGQARVFIKDNNERELNIALLRSGDYFGEQALLMGTPRSASVAALDDVEAVHLGRVEFLNLIQQHEDLRGKIDHVARLRSEQTERARNVPESREAVDEVLRAIQEVLESREASTR